MGIHETRGRTSHPRQPRRVDTRGVRVRRGSTSPRATSTSDNSGYAAAAPNTTTGAGGPQAGRFAAAPAVALAHGMGPHMLLRQAPELLLSHSLKEAGEHLLAHGVLQHYERHGLSFDYYTLRRGDAAILMHLGTPGLMTTVEGPDDTRVPVCFVVEDFFPNQSVEAQRWFTELVAVHEYGEAVLGSHHRASLLEFAVAQVGGQLETYLTFLETHQLLKFRDIVFHRLKPALVAALQEEGVDVVDTASEAESLPTAPPTPDASAQRAAALADGFRWPREMAARYEKMLEETPQLLRLKAKACAEFLIVNDLVEPFLNMARDAAVAAADDGVTAGRAAPARAATVRAAFMTPLLQLAAEIAHGTLPNFDSEKRQKVLRLLFANAQAAVRTAVQEQCPDIATDPFWQTSSSHLLAMADTERDLLRTCGVEWQRDAETADDGIADSSRNEPDPLAVAIHHAVWDLVTQPTTKRPTGPLARVQQLVRQVGQHPFPLMAHLPLPLQIEWYVRTQQPHTRPVEFYRGPIAATDVIAAAAEDQPLRAVWLEAVTPFLRRVAEEQRNADRRFQCPPALGIEAAHWLSRLVIQSYCVQADRVATDDAQLAPVQRRLDQVQVLARQLQGVDPSHRWITEAPALPWDAAAAVRALLRSDTEFAPLVATIDPSGEPWAPRQARSPLQAAFVGRSVLNNNIGWHLAPPYESWSPLVSYCAVRRGIRRAVHETRSHVRPLLAALPQPTRSERILSWGVAHAVTIGHREHLQSQVDANAAAALAPYRGPRAVQRLIDAPAAVVELEDRVLELADLLCCTPTELIDDARHAAWARHFLEDGPTRARLLDARDTRITAMLQRLADMISGEHAARHRRTEAAARQAALLASIPGRLLPDEAATHAVLEELMRPLGTQPPVVLLTAIHRVVSAPEMRELVVWRSQAPGSSHLVPDGLEPILAACRTGLEAMLAHRRPGTPLGWVSRLLHVDFWAWCFEGSPETIAAAFVRMRTTRARSDQDSAIIATLFRLAGRDVRRRVLAAQWDQGLGIHDTDELAVWAVHQYGPALRDDFPQLIARLTEPAVFHYLADAHPDPRVFWPDTPDPVVADLQQLGDDKLSLHYLARGDRETIATRLRPWLLARMAGTPQDQLAATLFVHDIGVWPDLYPHLVRIAHHHPEAVARGWAYAWLYRQLGTYGDSTPWTRMAAGWVPTIESMSGPVSTADISASIIANLTTGPTVLDIGGWTRLFFPLAFRAVLGDRVAVETLLAAAEHPRLPKARKWLREQLNGIVPRLRAAIAVGAFRGLPEWTSDDSRPDLSPSDEIH